MNRLFAIFNVLVLYAVCLTGQAMAEVNCETGVKDITKVIEFTQSLRIATSQGDISSMQSLVNENYVSQLSQCSMPTLAKLCDLACFDAIGQYYLFMSSEIAYYYAKSGDNKSTSTADDLQAYVNEGLKVVNIAQSFLAKAGTTAGTEGGFRSFVMDSTRFDILKIRLYMATGDNWYQSMSEQWLRRLDSMVSAIIEEPSNSSASSGSLAITNYEEALWILTESMMGLPDDPSFAAFEKELVVLSDEINRRIRSVESGYLYIGIDPMANSMRSVTDLKAELKSIVDKIADIENKVQVNVEAGLKAKADQQIDALNSKAREGDLSVSLSSYKIARIETEAAALKNEIEGKKIETEAAITRYNNESNKLQAEYDLTMSKIQTQFQLAKRVKEINDRISLLNGKKEIDVLNYNQSNIQRDIENLKWVMNWDIARTNLALQASSYVAQKESYEREKAANKFKRDQALLQKRQLGKAIDDLVAAVKAANIDKSKYTDQKDVIGALQTDAAVAEICSNELRIARLGGKPAKALDVCQTNFDLQSNEATERAAICSAQGDLKTISATNQAISLKCGIGMDGLSEELKAKLASINCSAQVPTEMEPTLVKLKALAAQEEDLEEAQRLEIEKKIAAQKSLVDLMDGLFDDMKNERKIVDAAFFGKIAATTTALYLPEVTSCACGTASGLATSNNLAAVAFNILKLTTEAADRKISYKQFVDENSIRISEARKSIDALKESLDVLKVTQLYQNLNRQKLVNDLYGEAMTSNLKLKEYMADEKLSKLDCNNQSAQLVADLTVLKMDHKRLMSDLEARTKSLDALQFDVDKSQIEADRYTIQIDSTNLKIQEIDSQIAALDEDDKRIDSLVGIAKSNFDDLKKLQGRLNANEATLTLQQRAEKEVADIIQNKTLNLDTEETDQLRAGLGLEESQADFLQNNIKSRADVITQRVKGLEGFQAVDTALNTKLNEVSSQMFANITQERKVIFDKLETAISDANNNDRKKVFVMTQDEIAQMVRGVPSFINSKRRLVEEANQKLVVMRNKANRLRAIAGDGPGSAEQNNGVLYVKTAQDIEELMTKVNTDLNTNNGPFNGQIAFRILPVRLEGALLQTALSKGRARFEISPFSGSAMESLTGNSFSVGSHIFAGDANVAASNHTLLDIFFEATPATATDECPVPDFFLRHAGSGYVFKTISEKDRRLVPSMIAGDPAFTIVNAFPPASGTASGGIAERKSLWQGKSFDTIGFDTFLKNSEGRNIWPLIGLPVVSTYEVTIPRTVIPIKGVMTECAYTSITAWVVYAYKPNIL